MKTKLIATVIVFCFFTLAYGIEERYSNLQMEIELREYELETLFAVRPSYGRRFAKDAAEISADDPLSAGDLKLRASDYAGALIEYRRLLAYPESPATWQGQINSMIANRKLGRYVDALENCNALIDSHRLPDRIKAYAQRNAALIAFYALCYDNIAVKNANLLKQNSDAPKSFIEQMDNLLKEFRIKRDTKELSEAEQKVLDSVLPLIRKDHPRMFFNQDTLPQLLEYIKRPAVYEYYLEYVKEPSNKIPDEPKIWNGETGLGRKEGKTYPDLPKPTVWGTDAARCALIYLVEKDRTYLEKAKELLKLCGEAALLSFDAGVMAGDYYSIEIIYALSTYDWLYNDLTEAERSKIIKPLLEYVYRCRTESHKFVSGESLPHQGGFYGTQMLKWFAGIAAIGDDIDEPTARKLLYEGYREHEIMLDIREIHTGDDGGFISVATNYTLNSYPWTSFNYLLTLESATGQRSDKVKHLQYYPQWCVWNFINGTEREMPNSGEVVDTYDFGVGDTGNTFQHKVTTDVSMHMYEIMHILHEDTVVLDAAKSLMFSNPFDRVKSWPHHLRVITPLLLFRAPETPQTIEKTRPSPKEHARFFEELGIAFMRSGSDRDDTYACFVTNKKYRGHRHYDANHFMIYKYDFLALDTGTRIGWTRGDNEHLNNYYAQTVAHNTILIHQSKEPLPDYWGTRKEEFYHNHGGQNSTTGDRCVAYETNDLFTYIAGDATATYSHEKCELALRQFVFIYPDIFVIADRVESTNPQYRKEFLMHTQHEPFLQDDTTWYADDGDGRMFCRTLLPTNSLREVVGGEGKEFWASGKNWELPEGAKRYAEVKNYFGQYRVEVSPEKQSKSDIFLHIIQVGKDTLPKMIDTETIENETVFGCEFEYNGGKWKILFGKEGLPTGYISFDKDEKRIINRRLRENIQPQSGLMRFDN